MDVTMEKTVRELALEEPGAARVFEKLGIDYCCGGKQTLEQACRAASIPAGKVLDALQAARAASSDTSGRRDWQTAPLADLISHIKSAHHKYTREEIARLEPLFDKVCSVHRNNHPELLPLREVFRELAQELTTHLMKEEMVLFPYIERMEESVLQHEPILPPPFGSVQNPVTMMEHEHDSAGNALRTLRASSNAYTPPSDACVSYQTLYKTLAELEADLHQHIHLENNILFPRAVALEKSH
jgi:regulator of cell morphogenesis and NO signaling